MRRVQFHFEEMYCIKHSITYMYLIVTIEFKENITGEILYFATISAKKN